MLDVGLLPVMTYESDLLRRIRDADLWPAFDRPDFLDDLDSMAERALSQGTVEGALAALLIYHQLTEESIRLLVRDSQFYIQIAVFPAEIGFPIRERQMFGQLLEDLKRSISFDERDDILELARAINESRIELVHRLTRQSTLADVLPAVENVHHLYEQLFDAFDAAHDHFRVCFHGFQKDVFIDYE